MTTIKKILTHAKSWYFNQFIPKSLARNFIQLDENRRHLLTESVKRVYKYGDADHDTLTSLEAELDVRLAGHRTQIIPWLNSVKPLKGQHVLEIGCGNGTSTVALAEQGAIVTAIDIEDTLLADAQERCKIYGLEARFYLMNATEVSTTLKDETYDLVLFYAVLEHMTYAERLAAIRQTYNMLAPGGLWCVIGTPNRLHFFDSHTSLLPFYYWLPDELAMQYASFSPRNEFGSQFANATSFRQSDQLTFARWGRGMSYHELELALGPLDNLTVLSSLKTYLKKRDILYRLLTSRSRNERYAIFLKGLYPSIHEAFFCPFLDLIIQK